MTRQQSYRQRLNQYVRSYVVMDLRDPIETRLARAERYARKNKTCGRRAVFAVSP